MPVPWLPQHIPQWKADRRKKLSAGEDRCSHSLNAEKTAHKHTTQDKHMAQQDRTVCHLCNQKAKTVNKQHTNRQAAGRGKSAAIGDSTCRIKMLSFSPISPPSSSAECCALFAQFVTVMNWRAKEREILASRFYLVDRANCTNKSSCRCCCLLLANES